MTLYMNENSLFSSQSHLFHFAGGALALGKVGPGDSLVDRSSLKKWALQLKRDRGGGLSMKKGRGCSSKILKRTPKRYQDSVLWVWLEMFSPLRDSNSKTTHYLMSYFPRTISLTN